MNIETNLVDPEVEEFDEVEDDSATDELDEDNLEESEESEDDEEDTDELEWAEIEINGQTYQVPADLKDGYMQQADYTRKTQAVAEQRKALEERITKVEEASETETKAQAEALAIDAALENFKGVDWDLLERQNPQEANRLFRQYQLLQQYKQSTGQKLEEARSQREAETQQVYAERFEQAMTELSQAIPNWGEEKAQSLKSFAESEFGFTDEEFRMALHDPRQIKLVNLAYAASKGRKSPKPSAPKPKPASKVRGGGSTPKRGLDDRLSTEEWMKRRNTQAQRKRK